MKMNETIEIWNILHDGKITAFEREGDILTMFVSIPYLRRRMKPLGDSFVLTLSGLTRADFLNFDGSPSSLTDELDGGLPEILSTDSETMPVAIATTTGTMILDFSSITFALDNGEPVSFAAIAKVCEEYCTEWTAKAEQARGHVR
jgi:hypothetical protein